MKKILLLISVLGIMYCNAQTIEQNGTTFTQVAKEKVASETKTKYTYIDNKGVSYDVYLSSTGKAFVKKTSKNGKEYRHYVPEIGKRINPDAYKEK